MGKPGQSEIFIVFSPFSLSIHRKLFNDIPGVPHAYPHGIGTIPRVERRPLDVFQSPVSTVPLISTFFKNIYMKKGRVS
jgi:hypothetical protein